MRLDFGLQSASRPFCLANNRTIQAHKMHLALQLSKILRYILDYLYSKRKSVYTATPVNRAWAEEVSAILWQHAPLRDLLTVPTERRQYYASLVCTLGFFTALGAKSAASVSLLHYTRLINLRLFVSPKPSVTFAGRCSRLQVLHAPSRPTWTAPHKTFELLCTNAVTLTQVELPFAITLPILARLAGLQRLENLRLCSHDGRLLVEEALALVAESAWRPFCFASLRRLCVHGTLPVFMALLPLLRQPPIVRLRIWFADRARMDTSDIGALSGLTEPLINWANESALSSAQLFALSSLTQLRKLSISVPGDVVKRCGISDNVFAKLVSGLGELRELYMAGTFALGELPIGDDNSNRPLFPEPALSTARSLREREQQFGG
jgi:hypothetical protein